MPTGRPFARLNLPMHAARSPVSPPPLVTVVHADDCGLSAGITDAIIRCHDHGWLRRTSVVVNGAGWTHAVSELRRRPALSLALHLNLFEGEPLSKPADVDLLVDRRGRFNRGLLHSGPRGFVVAAPRGCAANCALNCDGRWTGFSRVPRSWFDGSRWPRPLPCPPSRVRRVDGTVRSINWHRQTPTRAVVLAAPAVAPRRLINVVKNIALRAEYAGKPC